MESASFTQLDWSGSREFGMVQKTGTGTSPNHVFQQQKLFGSEPVPVF